MLASGGREDLPDLSGMLNHDSHSSDVQYISGGCHGRAEDCASSLAVSLTLSPPDLVLEELGLLKQHEL
eukprot:14664010-Heterocapsa_arctica.AAC.1